MEVQEFKDCGNGIFWPLRLIITQQMPGEKAGFIASRRYTLHSINQLLTDEDFQIHFPDWLRVHDRSSGKVTIWGPDDKPRMTFASQAEYLEWFRPRMKDPYQEMTGLSERARWAWLIGISLFVVLILALILRWRNKMLHRLRPASGNPEITSPPSAPEGR